MISNTGDIGAKFEWDQAAMEPYFSINPAVGYLSPGRDETFTQKYRKREKFDFDRKNRFR